jgi:hypothetical protein
MPFRQLREAVGARASHGEPLDTIEADLIEPSGLPDEHKSALWLYGWACHQVYVLRYQRRHQAPPNLGHLASPSHLG